MCKPVIMKDKEKVFGKNKICFSKLNMHIKGLCLCV